jgi:hypothetical protein
MKTKPIRFDGYWIFTCIVWFSVICAMCAQEKIKSMHTMNQENSAVEIKLRDCVIYLPDGAPPSVKKAADELQQHLFEVIGSKLDIVRQPATSMIALGDSQEARAAGINAFVMPYEGFRILSSGGRLFIVGRDISGDGPTTTDGLSLGTLYGTYEFLQSVIGIRWLMPCKLGTYFPPKNPDFTVSRLDISFTPKFQYRNFFAGGGSASESYDYARRNRTLNSQWKLDVTDHGWDFLYPNAGADDAAVVSDCMKAFENNPDIFSMSRNGKRMAPTASNIMLCLSNPELPEDVSRRVLNLYRAHPLRHIWCVGVSDGGPSCYCSDCQKRVYTLTQEEKGTCARGDNNEKSWTPLVLDFYRNTAEKIKTLAPDIYVNGLCYQNYEFIPRGVKPALFPDNFLAGMAPLHTAYGPVRLYEPINNNWKRWIDSWNGVFQKQFYYGLDFWVRQWAGAPMSPYPEVMKSTFQRLSDMNYIGAYFYSNPMGANAPYNWIVSQMLWKPDADPSALLEEFCSRAYGAGGKGIEKIYRLSDISMREFVTSMRGNIGHNMSPEMMRAVYAAHWSEYEACYREAAAGVNTPGEQWRFSILKNNLKILYYHLVTMSLIEEDIRSPLYLSSADYQRLVDSGYPGGALRGLVDTPPEAMSLTREWKPLKATAAEALPNAEPHTETFYGGSMEIICLADSDGEATLQLQYRLAINKATGQEYLPEIGYYHVFDGRGKKIVTAIARNGQIRFPVKKDELYCVAYMPLATKGSGSSWTIIKSALVRYAFGRRLEKRGLYVTDNGKPATPFYFYVPEKTTAFTMYINFYVQTTKSELIAPDGTVAAKGSGYAVFKVDRVKSHLPAGWWKIKMLDNASGFIQQGPELDGFFVDDPAKSLLVKMNL